MLFNYFKIAFRGYFRERSFTALNLLSLTIGLFVAYVAVGYIQFELSYDGFHKNAKSVYRLSNMYRSQGYSVNGFFKWSETTGSDQQQQMRMLESVTGVAQSAQFITSDALTFVEANGRKIRESKLLTTNTPQAFCSVFTWQLREGSFRNFADGTNKVMLTASTARKLFGEGAAENPGLINKIVRIGGTNYALAAIIDDVPVNSHVDFTMALNQSRIDYWGSRIYVQLEENRDVKTAEDQINAAIAVYNPKLAKDPLYGKHFLQPLTGIHLKSDILYELKPPGNANYMVLIGCFAVLVLVVTLFNYANLSIAIKSKQSKSIGVRKAMGAMNTAIALQFVFEGVLLALISLPLVVLLVFVCIPPFNSLMGVAINANVFGEPATLLQLTLLAVIIGLLASSFPAVYLAWKNVLILLKDNLKSNRYQNFPVRKYLVVSQFVILILITSVSYFIAKQIGFIENKDLGFRKDGILYAYSSPEKQDVFQQRLRQIPGVKSVGNGSSFGITPFNQVTYQLQGTAETYDDASQLYLDKAALKAYGLNTTLDKVLRSGGKLPDNFTLVNRTAAEQIAAKQRVSVAELVGKVIVTEPEYVDENGRVGVPFTIAGIFEDINLFSLHQKVEPYFITVSDRVRMDGRSIVQYDAAATPAVLAKIRSVHNGLNEAVPLAIEYLNENVAKLYRQDRQTATLLFCFNVVAVLLAALGIVGISIFLTVARTKEIGIRRVLGASAFSIVQSAVKEYISLIAISLAVSWPVATYVVAEWLKNFAYHVDIQHYVFPVVGLSAFLLTSLIVSIIAYRAALANPVKSLRSE